MARGPVRSRKGDAIGALRSTSHTRVLDDAGTREMLRRTRLGYHRVVAALASAGNDVIMDCPLSEPWRLDDLLDVLDGYPVMFIDVRCSTEELTRRERARGDRPAGLAAAQAGVHGRADYDLVVDTTRRTAADCAGEVVERFTAMGRPGAFERLRRARQT